MPPHRAAIVPAFAPLPIRTLRPSQPNRAQRYDRHWDLPRLVAMWPSELHDVSLAGRMRVLERLRNALRQERQRGRSGHWTYDLARHAQLVMAIRAEASALRAVAGRQRTPPGEQRERTSGGARA